MAEAMEDESKDSKGEIDEGLYSRQLYVMGREGQRRMATSDVLLIGLDGVGVEVAKNVILAGVKSVTLLDDTPASWMDMGAQFYVSEASLGKPRWATRLWMAALRGGTFPDHAVLPASLRCTVRWRAWTQPP